MALARQLQRVGAKALAGLEGVLSGPGLAGYASGGELCETTPYGMAVITLRALNPDKDSLSSLFKAAAETIQKGIELERKSIGMDAGPTEAAGQGERPSGVLSEEEFVAHHGAKLELLEALANTSRELARAGNRAPTIDGKAERLKS